MKPINLVQQMIDLGEMEMRATDPVVERGVELLATHYGYSAVMVACARLWRRRNPRGAALVGPTVAEAEAVLRSPAPPTVLAQTLLGYPILVVEDPPTGW